MSNRRSDHHEQLGRENTLIGPGASTSLIVNNSRLKSPFRPPENESISGENLIRFSGQTLLAEKRQPESSTESPILAQKCRILCRNAVPQSVGAGPNAACLICNPSTLRPLRLRGGVPHCRWTNPGLSVGRRSGLKARSTNEPQRTRRLSNDFSTSESATFEFASSASHRCGDRGVDVSRDNTGAICPHARTMARLAKKAASKPTTPAAIAISRKPRDSLWPEIISAAPSNGMMAAIKK